MANGDSAIRRFNHLLGELDAVYHDLSFRLGMSDSVSKSFTPSATQGSAVRCT